jgi:hypothetical protein
MDNALSSGTIRVNSTSAFASQFWRKTAFQIVITGCITFVVATVIAMLTYAGGTRNDPASIGYSFFTNFFSDLGRTVAYSGAPNMISTLLFSGALIFAGAGLALFFVAFTQFFTHTRWTRILSIIGSVFGVGAGICFIGIAFTPTDLASSLHGRFVLWAFGLFPLAVICYIPVILKRDEYPNIYAFSFIAFAVLLILYFALLQLGPRTTTPDGLMIQATGQKIIVYASIVSIFFQAWGALRVNSHAAQT